MSESAAWSVHAAATPGFGIPLLIADGDIPTTRILARILREGFGDVEVRTPDALVGTDVARRPIVISRLCHPRLSWLPRYLDERDAAYCYFLDDNFWEITPAIDEYLAPFYRHPVVRKTLDEFISRARSTLVMSQRLGKFIKNRFPDAHVDCLTPGFDIDKVQSLRQTSRLQARPDGEIRIGYPTSRRANVTALLAPVIEDVARHHAGRVQFEFVGWVPDALVGLDGVRLFPHISIYEDYLAFTLGRAWDIGIAPLVGESSESYKTNVKYREYGGCSVAGIYSRVPPYIDCVADGRTGLLVDNDQGAWIDAIERLISDVALRARIVESAYRDVSATYNQRTTAVQLRNAMMGKAAISAWT